ncbi:MAG: OpgC domain-containing protein [Acidobacteria bacterium]|nr:OpgC domain-containing protein [Acidobacteriota bacterium]
MAETRTTTAGQRLGFIDVSRTWAIILALTAHLFNAAGVFTQLDSGSIYIRSFTRMATPLFVFMFGFMFEYVYVPRMATLGYGAVRKRLLTRAFQCYVAYAATSISAVLGGYKNLEHFTQSLLFLGNSRFGNILRAYSVMLLLGPLLIRLRIRFGIRFVYVLLGLLMVSYTGLDAMQLVDFGVFNRPLNILLGIGPLPGGPSIWGALSFYAAGMIVASSLHGPEGSAQVKVGRFYRVSLGLLAIVAVGHWILVDEGAVAAWRAFTGPVYRATNDPGYYTIGIMGSVVMILFFHLIFSRVTTPPAIGFFLPLGVSSLMAYTLGNIVLNLGGRYLGLLGPVVAVAVFLVLVRMMIVYLPRLPFYKYCNECLHFRRPRLCHKPKP